jgi:hypothetical protein
MRIDTIKARRDGGKEIKVKRLAKREAKRERAARRRAAKVAEGTALGAKDGTQFEPPKGKRKAVDAEPGGISQQKKRKCLDTSAQVAKEIAMPTSISHPGSRIPKTKKAEKRGKSNNSVKDKKPEKKSCRPYGESKKGKKKQSGGGESLKVFD